MSLDSGLTHKKICFVGAGSMAEAIMKGLIEKRVALPADISVINRQDQERLQFLQEFYGVQVRTDESSVASFLGEADLVVLAMKPKDAAVAISSIRHHLTHHPLIVSVLAGVSIQSIQQLVQGDHTTSTRIPVVRTMPNTSSTIGLGMTGVAYSTEVTEDQKDLAFDLFEAVGEVALVEEDQLHIVTGMSGSGPAYIYLMMESMISAGIANGLSEEMAIQLTTQTVLGAANMVKTTAEQPDVLRKKVTSPNGTTQAAIETMQGLGYEEMILKAITRATERSRELGTMIENQLSVTSGESN